MYTVEQESGILLSPTSIFLCLVVLITWFNHQECSISILHDSMEKKKPKWFSVDLCIFYSITVIIPGVLDSEW